MRNMMRLVWVDRALVEAIVSGNDSKVGAANEFQLQRFVEDGNVMPGDVLMQGVQEMEIVSEVTHELTTCVQLLMIDRRRTELSDAEGDND